MFVRTFLGGGVLCQFLVLAGTPPPKNVERNVLGYVDRLKFCSLFLLIAQFYNNKRPPHNTSTTHINNQNEPCFYVMSKEVDEEAFSRFLRKVSRSAGIFLQKAFALPSAALPSHSMGMPLSRFWPKSKHEILTII